MKQMKFVRMTKPLEYPVRCGSKVVIPAGAQGVKIAFRASWLINPYTGEHMNVYIWCGRMYHGC